METETQRWVLKNVETVSRRMSEAERVLAQGIVCVGYPMAYFVKATGPLLMGVDF